MDQSIYRDGKVLTRNAFHKVLSKTLGATGEHDVWAGSAATMPQPNGTSPLTFTSASLQDAALVKDVWTMGLQSGNDAFASIEIDGVAFSCLAIAANSELTGLDAAIDAGSRESWLLLVSTVPDVGDIITMTIGATPYALTITTETTTDQVATALAALAAADAVYTVTAAGGGSGAIGLVAKTPNSNTATVTVTLSDTGAASVSQVVTHGPASTTHTAAVDGSTLVITAIARGIPSVITAESDNITLTHTVTGGAGSGVRSVRASYIDSDGFIRSEVVTLTGTTAASTTYDVVTLLDVVAHASGTTGAAGTITIADDTPTTIATIAAGDSEVKRLAYAVPTAGNGSWHLVNLQATVTGAAASILRVRVTGPRGPWLAYQANLPASTTSIPEIEEPIRIIAGETLRVTVEGNGSTTIVSLLGYGEGVSA